MDLFEPLCEISEDCTLSPVRRNRMKHLFHGPLQCLAWSEQGTLALHDCSTQQGSEKFFPLADSDADGVPTWVEIRGMGHVLVASVGGQIKCWAVHRRAGSLSAGELRVAGAPATPSTRLIHALNGDSQEAAPAAADVVVVGEASVTMLSLAHEGPGGSQLTVSVIGDSVTLARHGLAALRGPIHACCPHGSDRLILARGPDIVAATTGGGGVVVATRCSLADSAIGAPGGDVRALAAVPGRAGLFLAASERPMQLGGSLGGSDLQEAGRKASPEQPDTATASGPVDLTSHRRSGDAPSAHGALHALMNLTATVDAARRQRGQDARLALVRGDGLSVAATVSLPGLAVPDHLAVSPDGARVLVACTASGNAAVVELQAPGGEGAWSMAVGGRVSLPRPMRWLGACIDGRGATLALIGTRSQDVVGSFLSAAAHRFKVHLASASTAALAAAGSGAKAEASSENVPGGGAAAGSGAKAEASSENVPGGGATAGSGRQPPPALADRQGPIDLTAEMAAGTVAASAPAPRPERARKGERARQMREELSRLRGEVVRLRVEAGGSQLPAVDVAAPPTAGSSTQDAILAAVHNMHTHVAARMGGVERALAALSRRVQAVEGQMPALRREP